MPLARGWGFEASGFGGSVAASSFGTNYNTALFGGRTAVMFGLSPQFTLQLDGQGERTDNYCAACGNRSYLAGGTHLGLQLGANTDVGFLGGLDAVTPTFGASRADYGLFGLEGRQFFDGWMLGAQAGHFDVTGGTGALTDVWFFEGRGNLSVGQLFGAPGLQGLTIGGRVGFASGNVGNTAAWASSTQWDATVAYRVRETPLSVFFEYTGWANRTQGLGLVWTEHNLKGGLKLNFGDPGTPPKTLEPMKPLPLIAQTIMTF